MCVYGYMDVYACVCVCACDHPSSTDLQHTSHDEQCQCTQHINSRHITAQKTHRHACTPKRTISCTCMCNCRVVQILAPPQVTCSSTLHTCMLDMSIRVRVIVTSCCCLCCASLLCCCMSLRTLSCLPLVSVSNSSLSPALSTITYIHMDTIHSYSCISHTPNNCRICSNIVERNGCIRGYGEATCAHMGMRSYGCAQLAHVVWCGVGCVVLCVVVLLYLLMWCGVMLLWCCVVLFCFGVLCADVLLCCVVSGCVVVLCCVVLFSLSVSSPT